jgi:hypothetical protein
MVGGPNHKHGGLSEIYYIWLAKIKDRKYGQSYGLDVDPRLFCGVGFSGSMAQGESMP